MRNELLDDLDDLNKFHDYPAPMDELPKQRDEELDILKLNKPQLFYTTKVNHESF